MGELEYRLGRHRKLFCVIWYEGGKRYRHSLGTDNRTLAETRFTGFKHSHAHTEGPLTVGECYRRYHQQFRGQAGERIEFAWRRLNDFFGHLPPSAIHSSRTIRYIEDRKQRVGIGTIHLELGYLRAALRFAEKQGWITKAPYIPLPQKPPPKEDRLTRKEVRRLIDAAKMSHMRLFIALAIATAGRAGAILDLTWDRVDFNQRRIRLSNPTVAKSPKGRALVPMNATARRELLKAKKAALTNYVIEYGGKPVKSVKKGIAAAARRAGVKCTPHVLRHTAACLLAESGIPMEEIAQYLGHSNTDTTRRVYARFSPEYLKTAAKALEI